METMTLKKDRRNDDKIIFVERRKGKFRMYSQIVLSMSLVFYLLWLIK